MDHLIKPGVFMPSNNAHGLGRQHLAAVTAGVSSTDPSRTAALSTGGFIDRSKCTLCGYIGLDDNDLHKHFRETHWQHVLVMHQQQQEILNGSSKAVKSPPKYAPPLSMEKQVSRNTLDAVQSNNLNFDVDESVVAAANTILSISASNNALAAQCQRRNTLSGLGQGSNVTNNDSFFARPRVNSAIISSGNNGLCNVNTIIKEAPNLPINYPLTPSDVSLEDLQNCVLRNIKMPVRRSLASVAELPIQELSNGFNDNSMVANNLALELFLQNQQLSLQNLQQSNELNPMRLAAFAELRAAIASQLYANLQPQLATTSTNQLFLPLHQNAASPATAQNFWPQHLSLNSDIGLTQNTPASLNDDLQTSLQQIREQQHPNSRRHSIIPAMNVAPPRSTTSSSSSNVPQQQMRLDIYTSTTTPVTINTQVAASVSVAPASLNLRSPEEIGQHISRIISENEAILEPSPILTKRRTYTRQLNGSIQPQPGNNSSLSSPSLTGPREYRSNSLYSSFSPVALQRQNSFSSNPRSFTKCLPMNAPSTVVAVSNSCTSAASHGNLVENTALNFLTQVENETLRSAGNLFKCKFCHLRVRHVEDLKRHEEKCARRDETIRTTSGEKTPVATVSVGSSSVTPPSFNLQNKIPFKKQLLLRSGQDAVHCESASTDVKGESNAEPSVKPQCLQSMIQGQTVSGPKKHLTLPSILIPSSTSTQIAGNVSKIMPPTATVHLQPYTLSVGQKVTDSVAVPATGRKGTLTETCSLLSPKCSYFTYADTKFSLYAHYQHFPVDPKDALLNLAYMGSYALRARYSYLRYSQAKTRDSMRVTHSTYWKYAQQQLQLLETQQRSARKRMNLSPNACHSTSHNPGDQKIPKKQKFVQSTSPGFTLKSSNQLPVVAEVKCEDITTDMELEVQTQVPCSSVARQLFQEHTNDDHVQIQGICGPPSNKSEDAKGNAEESDETMSNDGLCVVTDDEDDRCLARPETNQLISELRQQLLAFNRIWLRILADRGRERLICPTPFLSDAASSSSSDLRSDLNDCRCSSAPPVYSTNGCSTWSPELCNIRRQQQSAFDKSASTAAVSPSPTTTVLPKSGSPTSLSNLESSKSASMEGLIDAEAISLATSNDSRITPIFTGGSTSNVCKLCGQKFEKYSVFVLHCSVHSIGRNTHKKYDYPCPHCRSNLRSRNLLQRHISIAHQKVHAAQLLEASRQESRGSLRSSAGPEASNGNTNGGTGATNSTLSVICSSHTAEQNTHAAATSRSSCQINSNDPRPFKCHYCDIAFRIHGHLAKHLRSKAHVMKLEALSLVPPGTLSMLEESDKLSQIDTSDCENSLRSLLKITEDMQSDKTKKNSKRASLPAVCSPTPLDAGVIGIRSSTQSSDALSAIATSTISLVCTESFCVATSPAQQENQSETPEGNSHKTAFTAKRSVTASGTWIPPKDASSSGSLPNSPLACSGTVSGELLGANVHRSTASAVTTTPPAVRLQSPFMTTVQGTESPCGNSTYPCRICDGRFSSQIDLDVHYHADHVAMRDGSFFKCPAKDCDTVYPTRLNLTNHLMLHYTGHLPATSCGNSFASSPLEHSSTPDPNNSSSSSNATGFGDRSDVSRTTVAALNRKLLQNDMNDANGFASKKAHCSRPSSLKSHCDCQKCAKQLSEGNGGATAENSPPPDSDVSRLSASSRSLSPTPPSRPTSKRSIAVTPSLTAACSSAFSSSDSPLLTSKRPRLMNGFYSQHQEFGQSAIPTLHSSILAAPVAVQGINRSFAPTHPQTQTPYSLVNNTNQLASLNRALSPQTAALLALQQHQQQQQALSVLAKTFYGWSGANAAAAAMFPQSILNAAAVAAAVPQPHLAASPHSQQQLPAAAMLSQENIRCIKCNKLFYSSTAVQQHLVNEHNEVRLHVCQFCDAGFTTSRALQAHVPCKQQFASQQLQ